MIRPRSRIFVDEGKDEAGSRGIRNERKEESVGVKDRMWRDEMGRCIVSAAEGL